MILQDPDAFATSLLLQVVDGLTTEFMEWTPENIDIEIQATFGIDMSVENFSKLMSAVKIVTGADDFWQSEVDFKDDCAGLSGFPVNDENLILPTSEELLWGIFESGLLSSLRPGESPKQFSEAITEYVKKTLYDEGVSNPPAWSGVESTVSDEFTDDPEMFSAMWTAHQKTKEELDTWLLERIQALISQLRGLKLKNGNTESVVRSLAQRARMPLFASSSSSPAY
jgi:hypothetical protein